MREEVNMAFNKKNLVKNQANIISKIEAGEIDISDETKNAITGFTKTPTIQKALTISNIIGNDNIITSTNKKELLLILANIIKTNINFQNCPDDYEDLKKESKYLSGLSQYSLMLMAQRLKKIRDEKKYLDDKDVYGNSIYLDFKDFIENEIKIGRTTVYNLIDVFDYYGSRVQALEHEENIQYAKLVLSIPILKYLSDESDIFKTLNYFWDAMLKGYFSFRELVKKANELKIKYGIIESKNDNRLVDVNYKYESKGDKINIGNKNLFTINPDFDSEKAKYFKNVIKTVSNNKENGKETYLAPINKGDEKAFKLLENKIKEAREKGLKLNIVLK